MVSFKNFKKQKIRKKFKYLVRNEIFTYGKSVFDQNMKNICVNHVKNKRNPYFNRLQF